MKILTLNINSIRAHAESFMDILRNSEYDTILVQELKVENANFPFMLFDEFGYNIKIFDQKSECYIQIRQITQTESLHYLPLILGPILYRIRRCAKYPKNLLYGRV